SRIIDKAALDTAARDCSGTMSRAFKKACATGLVPRGRRVEAGACFAMEVLRIRVARDVGFIAVVGILSAARQRKDYRQFAWIFRHRSPFGDVAARPISCPPSTSPH